MSNSYDNIYKLIKFTNSKVDYFEGTKKYISTGDSNDIENGQEVTFDNKPSRANVMGSAGDILIAKMANTNKVILLDNDTQNNIYSTGFYCLNSTKLFNKYLFYLLSNDEFNKEKDSWSFGTTQVSLNENGFKRIKINFVSDIIKQMKISKFLDKKVLLLDKILENQQQQIEKLKEYKQSLISEVVTKGLDPNVDFKDSGVDWIGKIPINWDIIRLKDLATNTTEKNEDENLQYIGLENIISKSFDFIKTDNFYNPKDGIFAPKNSVLFGKLRPYLTKSFYCENDLSCSSEFAVFLFDNEITSKYFLFITQSYGFIDVINMSTYGTKMPRANIKFINNLDIPLPSLEHQKLIVENLMAKVYKINSLIQYKTRKVEKLTEYKKSLIYEYVTGKKEVS